MRILRSRKLLDYSHDDGSGSYSGVLYSYVLTSVRVYNIDYAGLRAELGIENRLPQESDNIKNLEIKTNNRKIVFNEKNGDVFLNGKFLCSIRPRTRQYYFFLFLYQNSPEYRSYEEIVGYIVAESKSIDGKGRSEEEFSSYLSGIKNDLPKEIRKYIENGKHSYRLSEAKKPMKKGRKSREKRR